MPETQQKLWPVVLHISCDHNLFHPHASQSSQQELSATCIFARMWAWSAYLLTVHSDGRLSRGISTSSMYLTTASITFEQFSADTWAPASDMMSSSLRLWSSKNFHWESGGCWHCKISARTCWSCAISRSFPLRCKAGLSVRHLSLEQLSSVAQGASCFLTNTSLMCMKDCLLLLQLLFLLFQPFVEIAVLISLQNVFGVLELLFEF